jgi:hypothetical protein
LIIVAALAKADLKNYVFCLVSIRFLIDQLVQVSWKKTCVGV